jgi:hypothetical protein
MTYLEELKQYFANTTKEQVLQDFAMYDTQENDLGPTVSEFLTCCDYRFITTDWPPNCITPTPTNNELSPKFSSDFFYFVTFINSIVLILV